MREVELTTHQIREIYEQKQREYHINDARNHCDDYLEAHGIEIAFTQGDYEVMAERFEFKHDCDIADNAQWQYIVEEYIAENFIPK